MPIDEGDAPRIGVGQAGRRSAGAGAGAGRKPGEVAGVTEEWGGAPSRAMGDPGQGPTRRGGGRTPDPGRRDRIVDACLDVIAECGVAGTSHRRVAQRAGVPLGSMTYHFSGMDDLLRQAFTRFAQSVSQRFEERMRSAHTREEALAAVVAVITDDLLGTARDLVLTQELYTIAAREPAYRTITNHWMSRSRAALGLHFDADTARMLDALIEGLSLHRALDTEAAGTAAQDPAMVAAAVRRITSPAPGPAGSPPR